MVQMKPIMEQSIMYQQLFSNETMPWKMNVLIQDVDNRSWDLFLNKKAEVAVAGVIASR